MSLRTVLVDDERLARLELRRLLAVHPQVEIIGEAANGDDALALINAQQPDLAFLDVRMPGMDGLALAAQIDQRCQFVFCTAYDSYAIDAFGLQALDYLVKPVVPERLARTLERVSARRDQMSTPVLPMDHGLLLKFGERSRIIRLYEIDRILSIGNHAAVHSKHGVAYVLSPLARIEARLDPQHFCRVSRSCILRLDAIRSLDADVGSGLIATLADGSTVDVSRRAAMQLKARFDAFG
jgi:two-component system LytT family response regulator